MVDGLASAFTSSRAATLQAILKALNSYKHIYVINLYDTYSAMSAREIAQKCAEGKNLINYIHAVQKTTELLLLFLIMSLRGDAGRKGRQRGAVAAVVG